MKTAPTVPTYPQGFHARLLRQTQIGQFRWSEFAQGESLAWHRHDECSIALILDGAGSSITRGDEATYRRGHVVFEPPEIPHLESGTLRFLNIDFPAHVFAGDGVVLPSIAAPMCFEGGKNVALMHRIYSELTIGDAASKLALHGLTLELVAGLMRIRSPARTQTPPHWLRQVEDYIRAHFAESVSLDAMAAEIKRHPAHLSRTFRRFRGYTVGEHVRRLRVEYAVERIANSGLPLPTIAVQAGFYDQADMTRSVKRWTGKTPGKHRSPEAGR